MLNSRLLAWLALPILLMAGASAAGSPMACEGDAKTVTFANPELLLSTEWLAKHGQDAGVVVLDARNSREFAAGHVPGALNFATADSYDPKERYKIGSQKQIESLLGDRGVQASSHVVIYDGGRSTSAARLFWTLEVYGHEKVSVLDGGVAKWKSEKRPLTKDVVQPMATKYKARPRLELCSTMDQVLDDVENPEAVMLDSRSIGEFKSGRIPLAIRIEWTLTYTSDPIPVFKSPAALAKLYEDQGVTRDKRVHAY